jgi:hypothetical protein
MRKILLLFNLILSTIEEKKVKLVYEHFRHGARFPESNLNSEKKDLFNVYHEFTSPALSCRSGCTGPSWAMPHAGR